jgi:CMP-N,N'-diacetyllegionaminic acid synthase
MTICTICARGGSKGVKNKNLRLLHGLPLIHHTVRHAVESKIFQMVAVSSDSQEIINAAKAAGATFLIQRPEELATDTSAKLLAIRHALLKAEEQMGQKADILVDLDCTSPLRRVSDILAAVDLLQSSGAPNVITGAPARRSPYFNLVELQKDGTVTLSKSSETPIVRRQDVPACYDMNASIYVWRRAALLNGDSVFNEGTRLYSMPEDRSLDIDSELDFQIVEFLMNHREVSP